MRLVVDTNVFVSAALKDASWPGEVVRWVSEFGGLIKSTATET
jgi:predicted nucleic acid-binding protein